jgi:hypothetical protein
LDIRFLITAQKLRFIWRTTVVKFHTFLFLYRILDRAFEIFKCRKVHCLTFFDFFESIMKINVFGSFTF